MTFATRYGARPARADGARPSASPPDSALSDGYGGGRGGLRVGYLLKCFPRLSETFILNEVLEVERQGADLRIYSLNEPQEAVRHRLASGVRSPIEYLPYPLWRNAHRYLRSHAELFLRHPWRYTLTLIGVLFAFDRDLLGIFDLMMVVVLGLVLYGMSARDPSTSPGWMDRVQLVAVVSALMLDGMVLGSMVTRIGDLGFTPNRSAALGLNLVLLVNLAGSAWLSWSFLAGRGTFHRLERWQTTYLPVFGVWAAAVVVVLPLLFSFE